MPEITRAELIRSFLPEVQQRVQADCFDDEELYHALCVTVRMNSETRSDAECEDLADKVHSWITSRIV
jgi:hypothetical protein